MEDLQAIRPNFMNFNLPQFQQYGKFHNAEPDNYYNAGSTDPLTLLSQAIDVDGVKLNIDLTAKTYLYLVLTGIAIFAAGAVVWHFMGKAI